MNGILCYQSDSNLPIIVHVLQKMTPQIFNHEINRSKQYIITTLDGKPIKTSFEFRNQCSESQNSPPLSEDINSDDNSKNLEIFVGGLSSETIECELFDYFSKFGQIESCQPQFWMKGSKKFKCRGYALVSCLNQTTFDAILAEKSHTY